MLRPPRLVTTAVAVLVPIAVASGSGAPPVPVSAPLTSQVAPAPETTTPSLPQPSVLGIAGSEPRTALTAIDAAGADDVLDIPATALAAYQRAVAVIAQVDPACGLDWQLLAAIGRVESDHGRVGGATLNADGTSTPTVLGPVLDGHGPMAAVSDTDGGVLDGDAQWDRAVGPMQFLPSTWVAVSVDADGDGVRSASDIDDAALGAAVYLCSGLEDLGTTGGARSALLRYNHSAAYASEVLDVARAYEQSAVPSTGSSVEAIVALHHSAATDTGAVATAPTRHDPGTTGAAVFVPAHSHGGGSKPTRPHGHPAPVVPVPDPTPADPTPGDPADPTPSDPPPTEPTDPTPDPEPSTLTGTLTPCVDEVDTWCVGDVTLDLGGDAYLSAAALDDFDGDGTIESNREEISGLVDTEVTLEVEDGSSRVVSVNGLAYLASL